MKTRWKLVVRFGAILSLLAIATIIIGSIKPARDIKIIVDGNPNQRLTGRFVADGIAKHETLKIPFERSFKANRVSFWLLPEDPAEGSEITLQIRVNDVPWWPLGNNKMSLGQGVKATLQTPGLFALGRNQMGTAGTSAEEIAAIGYHECVD